MTVNADADPAIASPSGATFKINDTKLYVPVVTLSNENDTKRLEQLKTGFKRTIKWNKYRSQMTVQLLCHFKELLEKIIQQKIIEIIFHTIMYQTLK